MTSASSRRRLLLPIIVAVCASLVVPTASATAASPASAPSARVIGAPGEWDVDVQQMTVTGRIIDENGWPVARLGVKIEDSEFLLYADRVVTNKNGYFTLYVDDRGAYVPAEQYAASLTFDDFGEPDAVTGIYLHGQFQFYEIPPLAVTLTPGEETALGEVQVSSTANPGRAAGSVKSGSKKAVRKLYRRGFEKNLRRERLVSVSGCTVAKTPKPLQKRDLAALNVFRSLAGEEPVTLGPVLSKRASKAALIQRWQGYLSHTPSPKAKCATKVGVATSGKSNLSFGEVGPVNMLGYMTDPGSSNVAAGHRAWFLSPGLEKIGTGYADWANAVHVVSRQDPGNATPQWITWPTAGYFPAEFEPWGRWSFMTRRADLDFAKAKVTMTVAGKPVKVSVFRDSEGYGYLTGITWDLAKHISVRGNKTVKATVTISNIVLRESSTLPPVTYTVKLFNAGT